MLARAASIADELGGRIGVELDAALLLSGRAAQLGLTRRGRISAGGATRLLTTRSGWCALTLSRPDDVGAVPALMECGAPPEDTWVALERWAATRSADDVVGRARLLGLPAALLGEALPAEPGVRRIGRATAPRAPSGLLVVDMSSMWAGPLCAQILAWAGATVVKVESPVRPDGTRLGPRGFFDWVNGGKFCYAADFDDPRDLRNLLEVADVVITSSRPAAMEHRRLRPGDVPARDGRVWLRITGHGVAGEHGNRVAFGDDAAVAAGLVGRSAEGPVFCADAIADPLTGLHAALAVVEALSRGGGEIVDVAMAAVAATYAALPEIPSESHWTAMPPTPPSASEPAADLGADNAYVNRLIAERRLARC